ncbi:MAG: hypothetical protein JKY54_00095 [Flavobacteriales bacterium]|nr:hypothetical protein [Flavobacteriales bacterium]
MKIEIQSGNRPILTEVINRTDFSSLATIDTIEIRDEIDTEKDSFDLCVRIVVDGFREVHYFINDNFHGLQDLAILLIEETETLFIGGKSNSIVVDLIEGKTKDEFQHFLFWGFRISSNGQYILDEGETDCLLRDKSGKILNQVDVEPPYEAQDVENGVKYICDGITGEVILEFNEKPITKPKRHYPSTSSGRSLTKRVTHKKL